MIGVERVGRRVAGPHFEDDRHGGRVRRPEEVAHQTSGDTRAATRRCHGQIHEVPLVRIAPPDEEAHDLPTVIGRHHVPTRFHQQLLGEHALRPRIAERRLLDGTHQDDILLTHDA